MLSLKKKTSKSPCTYPMTPFLCHLWNNIEMGKTLMVSGVRDQGMGWISRSNVSLWYSAEYLHYGGCYTRLHVISLSYRHINTNDTIHNWWDLNKFYGLHQYQFLTFILQTCKMLAL
jgi:hypothetical protein